MPKLTYTFPRLETFFQNSNPVCSPCLRIDSTIWYLSCHREENQFYSNVNKHNLVISLHGSPVGNFPPQASWFICAHVNIKIGLLPATTGLVEIRSTDKSPWKLFSDNIINTKKLCMSNRLPVDVDIHLSSHAGWRNPEPVFISGPINSPVVIPLQRYQHNIESEQKKQKEHHRSQVDLRSPMNSPVVIPQQQYQHKIESEQKKQKEHHRSQVDLQLLDPSPPVALVAEPPKLSVKTSPQILKERTGQLNFKILNVSSTFSSEKNKTLRSEIYKIGPGLWNIKAASKLGFFYLTVETCLFGDIPDNQNWEYIANLTCSFKSNQSANTELICKNITGRAESEILRIPIEGLSEYCIKDCLNIEINLNIVKAEGFNVNHYFIEYPEFQDADFILHIGSKKFYVHSQIIGMSSFTLRNNMISKEKLKNQKNQKSLLELNINADEDVMKTAILIMYNQEFASRIRENQVDLYLQLAERYNIYILYTICSRILMKPLWYNNPTTISLIWKYSLKELKSIEMEQKNCCIKGDELLKTEVYQSLNPKLKLELIEHLNNIIKDAEKPLEKSKYIEEHLNKFYKIPSFLFELKMDELIAVYTHQNKARELRKKGKVEN